MSSDILEQYMALALQPVMQGAHQRADIVRNLDHIAELARAAIWLTSIDLPVRLITVPEGALQGFTDEIFDWDHRDYVERTAIDIPGPETEYLADLARDVGTFHFSGQRSGCSINAVAANGLVHVPEASAGGDWVRSMIQTWPVPSVTKPRV